jgi:hypothetical protein
MKFEKPLWNLLYLTLIFRIDLVILFLDILYNFIEPHQLNTFILSFDLDTEYMRLKSENFLTKTRVNNYSLRCYQSCVSMGKELKTIVTEFK